MSSDYNTVLTVLDARLAPEFNFRAKTPELKYVHAAAKRTGNPHLKYKVIHITGTNGKGSVGWKLGLALRAMGYNVGLFSSPEIRDFRERMLVNHKMVPKREIAKVFNSVFTALKDYPVKFGFFELVTLGAFKLFAEREVDYVVLEVGIGAKLDTTKIVRPLLSIMTSIGLDHTNLLGKTVEKITADKAHIIRYNTPVVIGPTVPKSLVSQVAEAKNAKLICASKSKYNGFGGENKQIAICALKALELQNSHTRLLDLEPPCRFEQVELAELNAMIILDAAHNPPGLEALFSRLNSDDCHTAIFCLSNTKDLGACLDVLRQHITTLYLPRVENNGLFYDPEKILNEAKKRSFSHVEIVEFDGAFKDKVREKSTVCCGSFHMMDACMRFLGAQTRIDGISDENKSIYDFSGRELVRWMREIAAEDDTLTVVVESNGWLLTLEKGDKIRHVLGTDFGLNPSSVAAICQDKVATSDVMSRRQIPHIEHRIIMTGLPNLQDIHKRAINLFLEFNRDVVCKPNEGTCGKDVERIRDEKTLNEYVTHFRDKGETICISPFCSLYEEYRVILLDHDVKLVYAKERDFVVGNGKDTLEELIFSHMANQVSNLVDLHLNPLFLEKKEQVLAVGERFYPEWKHNLSTGAQSRILDALDSEYKEVVGLARKVQGALGFRMASVDLVRTDTGELKLMEVNQKVSVKQFSVHHGDEIGKSIFRAALEEAFAQPYINDPIS